MVRSLFCAVFLALLGQFFVGCSSTVSPYLYVKNWVIRENAVPAYFAEYDLLFIYPRIARSGDRWPDLPANRLTLSYVHDYAEFVTQEAFGKKVRVFAPVIHRTEDSVYARLLEEKTEEWDDTEAQPAIEEVVEVIRFYLKTYHTPKRPYVLLGHGQGSVLLYEALKELEGEVRPDEGFVAAYLPELPDFMIARVAEDFDEAPSGKYISPVRGRFDTGVLAAWRTEVATPANALARPSSAPGLVNPLNWSVIRPSDATNCVKACYYDINQTNVLERKITSAGYVRVEPDGSNLCLRVEKAASPGLPEMPLVGETVSLFTGNIVINARERVMRYLCKARWDGWETEEKEMPINDAIEPAEEAPGPAAKPAEGPADGKGEAAESLLGDLEGKEADDERK